MTTEIEVKFLNIDKEDIRAKLHAIGASLVKPEFLQKRKTFDFPHYSLKPGEYKWLRIRDEGDKVTMTLKRAIEEDRIDNTKELEIKIDNFETATQMIKEMDWVETNYQENYRERWLKDDVDITIDTWPLLNPFIEIEGPSEEKVKKVAQQLGFEFKDALFGAVDYVYEKVLGIKPSTLQKIKVMTFENIEEVRKEIGKLKNS